MRVAIHGARGQVGQALLSAFADLAPIPLTRDDFDLADPDRARAVLEHHRPDLLILTSAYVDVNAAERDPDSAFRVNALGARWVAQAAERVGAGVVYLSSDYVFAGDGGAPYDEWAAPRPLSVYGRSKLAGEGETLQHATRAWVVRTSWVYGGTGKTFVKAMQGLAASGKPVRVVTDERAGPTYASDLAAAIRALVERDAPGIYHLANAGECSRYEWARAILELSGSDASVEPIDTAQFTAAFPGQAPRPAHSTLANRAAAGLGIELRPWRDALEEHLCASR